MLPNDFQTFDINGSPPPPPKKKYEVTTTCIPALCSHVAEVFLCYFLFLQFSIDKCHFNLAMWYVTIWYAIRNFAHQMWNITIYRMYIKLIYSHWGCCRQHHHVTIVRRTHTIQTSVHFDRTFALFNFFFYQIPK